ncbi:hypothetical protein QWA68_006622 [Fusarium oxysporum]|nr:hypothetical protein QWA68_006622 [Fusarium oxysporum]
MVANNLPILIRPQGPQYITTLGACRAQAVKRKRHRLVELVGDGIPAGSLRWFPFYQDRKLVLRSTYPCVGPGSQIFQKSLVSPCSPDAVPNPLCIYRTHGADESSLEVSLLS